MEEVDCPLLAALSKVAVIKDVYESRYVNKSLVVCGFSDLNAIYHMNQMLRRLDFPVDVLTVRTAKDVLTRFTNHSLRTLIVGELMGAMLETHLSFLLRHIDLVFVDESSVVDKSWIKRAFKDGQTIVYI